MKEYHIRVVILICYSKAKLIYRKLQNSSIAATCNLYVGFSLVVKTDGPYDEYHVGMSCWSVLYETVFMYINRTCLV